MSTYRLQVSETERTYLVHRVPFTHRYHYVIEGCRTVNVTALHGRDLDRVDPFSDCTDYDCYTAGSDVTEIAQLERLAVEHEEYLLEAE